MHIMVKVVKYTLQLSALYISSHKVTLWTFSTLFMVSSTDELLRDRLIVLSRTVKGTLRLTKESVEEPWLEMEKLQQLA